MDVKNLLANTEDDLFTNEEKIILGKMPDKTDICIECKDTICFLKKGAEK